MLGKLKQILRSKRGSNDIGGVVVGLILAMFIFTTFVGALPPVTGTGNATAEQAISYGWQVFGFLALGVLLGGLAYLRKVAKV